MSTRRSRLTTPAGLPAGLSLAVARTDAGGSQGRWADTFAGRIHCGAIGEAGFGRRLRDAKFCRKAFSPNRVGHENAE